MVPQINYANPMKDALIFQDFYKIGWQEKRIREFLDTIRKKKYIRVLSLGAGVQSSTLAFMAERKVLEKEIDIAIFADTGWEPRKVYEYLQYVKSKVNNFPILTIQKSNLREDALSGERFGSLPLYTKNGGMLRRQCTRDYKIDPINRKIKEILGIKRFTGQKVATLIIGISLDEIHRAKPNRIKSLDNEFPLLDMRFTRQDCQKWLQKQGYDCLPPKSACIGCPYHVSDYWKELKLNNPVEFADACDFDEKIRKHPKFKNDAFLHRSCVPLREINFKGESSLFSFDIDCDSGMCGL